MKKTVKQVSVGITALVISTSILSTSAPALAAEYAAINESAFIASFETDGSKEVAEYLMESGAFSISEANEIMESYVESEARLVESAETTSDDTIYVEIDSMFYSTTNLASSPHYVAVVNSNMNRTFRGSLDLLFNSNYSYYDDYCTTYPTTASYVTKLLPIYENNDLALTYKVEGDTTLSGSQVMCLLKVGVGTNTLSENTLNASISMVDTSNVGGFSKFTYAVGDIDHNGILDADDVYYLSSFLLARDLEVSYAGEYEAIVRYAFAAAMDVNVDGIVDAFDLSLLKRYIQEETE
ncbi:MAG: dockerin type I repeat-containing protein [Ruminococcus sp.]|nr:dockerin type I repeat-containing protein [Ruminococcus sp.]